MGANLGSTFRGVALAMGLRFPNGGPETKVNVYKGPAFPQEVLWDSLSDWPSKYSVPSCDAVSLGHQSWAHNKTLARLKFALFGKWTIISCAWSDTQDLTGTIAALGGKLGTACLVVMVTFLLQHPMLCYLRPDLETYLFMYLHV